MEMEQLLIIERTVEMGAGMKLKDDKPHSLTKAVAEVLGDARAIGKTRRKSRKPSGRQAVLRGRRM